MNYNQGKLLPDFPTEAECIIRKRIGELKKGNDTWYNVQEQTDEKELIDEMQLNIYTYILPFFDSINTKETLITTIDNEKVILAPLGKLIAYSELKQFDKAKKEYESIMTSNKHPDFLITVKEYGQKYHLD